MKQTQTYVCTLLESARIAVQLEDEMLIGKYTGLYTIATMDEKCENCSQQLVDRRENWELHSIVHFVKFILEVTWIHCCTKLKFVLIYIGIYTGIYTHATIAWAKWEMLLTISWQESQVRISCTWETVTLRSEPVKCHSLVCIAISTFWCQLGNSLTLIISSIVQTVTWCVGN